MRRWPSVQKAKDVLGWEARIALDQGLADTVAWLREVADRAMSVSDRIEARLARLRESMASAGVGLTAIAPTDNLRWLLGFAPLYDERACALLVSAEGVAMLMPSLNAEQTAAHAPGIELVRWADEDGPEGGAARDARAGRVRRRRHARRRSRRCAPIICCCSRTRSTGTATVDAGDVIWPLREIKDGDELAVLHASAEVADRAIEAAWAACARGGERAHRRRGDQRACSRRPAVSRSSRSSARAPTAPSPTTRPGRATSRRATRS